MADVQAQIFVRRTVRKKRRVIGSRNRIDRNSVAKIETKSLRGAGGMLIPKTACKRSAASSVISELPDQTPRNTSVNRGEIALKASFKASGITTSLTSGLPRRETCTQSLHFFLLPPALITRVVRRLAVDQTPITASDAVGCRHSTGAAS